MVIGNLTRKERVLDILADIHDIHEIQNKDERIQQLESIAESIGELGEKRSYEQCLVHNLAVLWRDDLTGAAGFTIADDIDRLHDYMQQSLFSKTIRKP
jgi:hypothetical protein